MADFQESIAYGVIVVGLGGHGSSIAAHISKNGTTVLGLEQFGRTHKHGSSHGNSRVIRTAYFEDARYVPLLQRSMQLWKELDAEESSRSPANKDYEHLLVLKGGLMIGPRGCEIITGTIESATTHNLRHEILTAEEVTERFPLFKPAEDEVGVLEMDAGYLVPELCVLAHQRVAEEHGAELHFEEGMTGWSRVNKDIIEVTTTKGRKFHTKKLVLSVGAWAPEIFGSCLPMSLHVERRVLYWFEPKEGTDERDFQSIPIYLWNHPTGCFYGFPHQAAGEGVKVALHGILGDLCEKYKCTPTTIDRVVHEEEINEIRRLIEPKIPSLCGRLLNVETCMYTKTQDEHFLIDFLPSDSDVVLVSPCSGHGFKFCSVVGEIVKDLVLHGETTHDISLFRISDNRK